MNNSIEREEAVFYAALALTDQSERRLFLDKACAGDPELRSSVEALLAAQGAAEQFFSRNPPSPKTAENLESAVEPGVLTGDVATRLPGDEPVGARIGRYKLLQRIGEGGCGVVYMAEQQEPVRRRVALKIIKLGMDTRSVIARFEAERQALAMMDHPNIAHVFDAGATEMGRPFFVMELVHGVKITDYCDQKRLDARQRLDLFIQICHAIQHAHQKGIIHRDIKPSNILVTSHDGLPLPKVIDFGIAKATGESLTGRTLFTSYGHLVGTPAYMSPEQAEMNWQDVDTRSDIYCLGVLLYEMLTGRTPFDQKELLESGLDEMRRTLRETEPRKPSNMVTTFQGEHLAAVALHRQLEPPKLISLLRGDLDWIVMKALEKDRARRYATASGLAADIRRHLNNEPVEARPPGRFYRLQKLVRRNRAVFVAGILVAFALIIGLGSSTWLFLREREARASESRLRQQAEAREKITQAAVLISHDQFAQADQLLGEIPLPLIQPSLECANVFRSLGQWHATHERWREAATRFLALLRVNQVDGSDQTDIATGDLVQAAPALIELGDYSDYKKCREAAVARFAGTTDPIAAEQVIKTSLLLPADESLIRALTPIAEMAAESFNTRGQNVGKNAYQDAWRSVALAMVEYRRGNWPESNEWCRKCLAFPDRTEAQTATSRIILAMTDHQLGRESDAHSQLDQARELIKMKFSKPLEFGNPIQGFWFDWVMARILFRQAEALVEGTTK